MTPPVADEVARIRQAARSLLEIADRLESTSPASDGEAIASASGTRRTDSVGPEPARALIARESGWIRSALMIHAARRRRRDYFPAACCHGLPWDILLNLYIFRSIGQAQTSLEACLSTGIERGTALRWVRLLAAEQLVAADHTDPAGAPRFVSLSQKGFDSMERYLDDIGIW